MYRDGNFQSLRWNMLEASHKAHWEKLSSVYGLEEPEKLLKSEAQKKDMPVLDQLAELCICSCQNYLFSLTPVKDVSNVFNDVLTAPDDLPRRIRRDMPHHFELALRDHLIVTFAYRFCCDNLEPRSFDDYVNTLFDYIAEFDKTANPIDLAEIRKNYRRDFRKDFRNKYRNFCEQFTLTTSESGGECSNNPQAGPADNPSENTTCKGKEKQAIANVVTTGTLTIPMMKKTGYTAEEAGAIETCASTGGQIMPPIMGTGAFILAETVGVPYSDVCFVSIIPAILFYIAIYFLVDLIARKRNLHGLPASDIRPLKQTMHAGGVFFIPILILVVLLVLGYTPFLSGVGCALLILLIGQIRKDTRVSAKKIVFALEDCAKSLMSIGGVIFCASLIVSMINITGLMMKTSAIILSFSQGKLWLTLLLVALIAYILGMGLPISTSYIILATLSAPAIVSLGVDMLVVHLTIFWFTQLATITPPVCMTAFAAAGIAQGQPMKTGFTALKMGFTFYYVPVLFVYSQLINGAWWVQCIIAVFAIIAIYFLGTFTEKYFMGDLGNIQRFTGLAIFAVIYFMMFDGLTMPMRGALLALAVALIASLYIVQKKKQQAAA